MPNFDADSKTYSTREVAEMSGFSVRQIGYWADQKFVIPSVQQADGPGTLRRYSFDDLLQLRFVRQLRKYGWSIQKIRQAINKLREVMDDPHILQKAIPIHGANTILAICKTKEGERILLDCLDAGGQQVTWIYLWALQEETQVATTTSREEKAVTRRN